MIIKLVLILLLLVTAIYGFTVRKRSNYVGAALSLLSVIGILFVIKPEFAGAIANAIGVGRGADLMLYISLVMGILLVINLHVKISQLDEMITILARDIAVSNAKNPTITRR